MFVFVVGKVLIGSKNTTGHFNGCRHPEVARGKENVTNSQIVMVLQTELMMLCDCLKKDLIWRDFG